MIRENHSLTPLKSVTRRPDSWNASRLSEESLRLGLLDHPRHVRKDHVGVLLLGQRVGLGPELLVALADGRNEVVFLHVARSERSVEVVDQCYGKSEFHRFQSFVLKLLKIRRLQNRMACGSVKPSDR